MNSIQNIYKQAAQQLGEVTNIAEQEPTSELSGKKVVVLQTDKVEVSKVRSQLLDVFGQAYGKESGAYVDDLRKSLLGEDGKGPEASKPLTGRQIQEAIVYMRATPENVNKVLDDALKVAKFTGDARNVLQKTLAENARHPDVIAFLNGETDKSPREKYTQLCKVCALAAEIYAKDPASSLGVAYLSGFACGARCERYDRAAHGTQINRAEKKPADDLEGTVRLDGLDGAKDILGEKPTKAAVAALNSTVHSLLEKFAIDKNAGKAFTADQLKNAGKFALGVLKSVPDIKTKCPQESEGTSPGVDDFLKACRTALEKALDQASLEEVFGGSPKSEAENAPEQVAERSFGKQFLLRSVKGLHELLKSHCTANKNETMLANLKGGPELDGCFSQVTERLQKANVSRQQLGELYSKNGDSLFAWLTKASDDVKLSVDLKLDAALKDALSLLRDLAQGKFQTGKSSDVKIVAISYGESDQGASKLGEMDVKIGDVWKGFADQCRALRGKGLKDEEITKQESKVAEDAVVQTVSLMTEAGMTDLSQVSFAAEGQPSEELKKAFADYLTQTEQSGGKSYADDYRQKLVDGFSRMPPAVMNLFQSPDINSSKRMVFDILLHYVGEERFVTLPDNPLSPGEGALDLSALVQDPSLDQGDPKAPSSEVGTTEKRWTPMKLEVHDGVNGAVVTSYVDNPGAGDCFFYSVLNGLNAVEGKKISPTDANAQMLRKALVDHIGGLLEKAAKNDPPPVGFRVLEDSVQVLRGDVFEDVTGALDEYLGTGSQKDHLGKDSYGRTVGEKGFWADNAHAAFIADMLKRPVVVVSKNEQTVVRYDRDLSTGRPLSGDPICLYFQPGHYMTCQLVKGK